MSRKEKKKGEAEKVESPPSVESPATEKEQQPAGAEQTEESIAMERYMRLQADFENYRKRTARERTELFLLANEGLMEDLLPVLDHFEMGLATAEKEGASAAILAGLRLVYDQFIAALDKSGLKPFDATGSVFDPHHHEAINYIPSAEYAADTVITQIRRGYRLGNRLLRPAQVVVSSGAPRTGDAVSEENS